MALALADHFKKLGHEPTFRIQEDFVHAYVEVQGDYYDYTGLVNTHPDLPTKSKSDLLRAALRSGHSRDDILSDYQAAREMIEACDEPLIEATRLDELFGFGKNKKMNRSQIVARLSAIEKRKGEIIRDMTKRSEVQKLSSEQQNLTQQLSIAMESKLTEGKVAYNGNGFVVIENPTKAQIERLADKAEYDEEGLRALVFNGVLWVWDGYFANHDEVKRLLGGLRDAVGGHIHSSFFEIDVSEADEETIREYAKHAKEQILACKPLLRFYGSEFGIKLDNGYQDYWIEEILGEGLISESSGQTLTLWHGGRNLQSDYLEVRAHKKGRWEHGPGLYLTTHRDTAVKYAKGGGRVYEVIIAIDPSKELNEVEISMDSATEFVERHVMQKFRSKIINDLESSHDRRGRLTASTLVNLCLNYEAIPNTKTDKLRRFLIDNGVDYTEVSRYGGRDETVYVVINPSIIQGVS